MNGGLNNSNEEGTTAPGSIFNDLLESSKNLPSTSSELGSIQLSLNEINRRTRELRNVRYKDSRQPEDQFSIKRNKNDQLQQQKPIVDHTKAHYLLANSGVVFDDIDSSLKFLQNGDANKLRRTQTNEQQVSRAPLQQGSGPTEIDSYLRIKKEENILSSIESLLSNAAKDFDSFVNSNLNLDWNQRKNTIRENFGILVNNKTPSNLSQTGLNGGMSMDFVSETLKRHAVNPEIPVWGNNSLRILNDNNNNESKLNVNENNLVRGNFETHAKIIYKFNNSRQSGQPLQLTKEFIDLLTKDANNNKNRQMLETWKILDTLNDENQNHLSNKDIVNKSRTHLEKQFLDYVNFLYSKKMDEGLPTNINKIKSFIDSKLKNTDNSWKIKNLTIANSIPIWALIFYLLRAGLKNEALEVAISNKSSFKKVEQSFLSYFKAYISSRDGTLPMEFSTKLHTEYNQHIKNSLNGDPFRLAVYKIIGRCDLTRKNISSVTLNVEDWLWVHFMLMKDDISEDDPIYERYTFTDFQNIVTSYGPARFTNHYLQVLVLSGLYELAIAYVYSINEMDAVHLAIGMASLNLLKFPSIKTIINKNNSNGNAANSLNQLDGGSVSIGERFLSVNAQNEREIDFIRIISNYIKSFKFSDPRIATEYIILIGLSTEKQNEQVQLCHEALRELVLDTKEFSILLGQISRDGTRIPGVIEERSPLLHLRDENEFLRVITEQAARKADEDGRVHDSLLLYQLSEEYDIVLTIVNNLLGDLLSNADLTQPLLQLSDNSETNPILLARKLISTYVDNLEISKKISNKSTDTCLFLLKMVDIRELFNGKQWQQTLTEIKTLNILPFADELSAREKAQEFTTLNSNLIKCVPNLLIITMTCISKLVTGLNKSEYQSMEKAQQINSLKNIAKNCMIYAGVIQYKMPRETFSTLINLDVTL